jgi:hypothetical protein
LLALRFGQILWRLIRGEDVHLLGDEAKDALKLQEPAADAPTPGARS